MAAPRNNLVSMAPCSMGILACSIIYYGVTANATSQMGSGADLGGIPSDVLNHYGGYIREGIWDNGWQRFVLPMFLHANLIHIIFNMMALFRYGPVAEVHFGSENFFSIYFLSGILGICIGLIFGEYSGPGIGASGAIFGIMGSILAINLAKSHDWRRALRSSEVRVVSWFILVNFLICFLIPNVDHYGHLGGLLAGVGYGFLFEYWRKNRRISLAVLVLSLLFIGAAIAGSRWMIWNPHYYVHLGLRAEAAGDEVEAQKNFELALQRGKTWRSKAAIVELLEAMRTEAQKGEYLHRERYTRLIIGVAPKGLLREWGLAETERGSSAP